MAHTARAEADCEEFFDDAEALEAKIKQLAVLIRNSKYFCAFTGAGSFLIKSPPILYCTPLSSILTVYLHFIVMHPGISTAAGIADFRSGINTVLDTGTGQWAAKAAKQQGNSKKIKKNKKPQESIKAIPTASHMALVSLMTSGPKYLKCLISQNTDGLHRRSGIPPDQLCELHGNSLSALTLHQLTESPTNSLFDAINHTLTPTVLLNEYPLFQRARTTLFLSHWIRSGNALKSAF